MKKFHEISGLRLFRMFLYGLILAQVNVAAWAASISNQPTQYVESHWGGHLRFTGGTSWPENQSYLQPADQGGFYDGSIDFRLNNKLFFAEWGYFETHYEIVASGGDTQRHEKALQENNPDLFKYGFLAGSPPDDDRRLLDLTKTLHQNDGYVLYHRLDRFSLTLQPQWGTIRIGRQALTWGNGLLFNPMDLFNPFAPTDIIRDYKVGDDMLTVNCPLYPSGNLQLLYVPRRNPANGHVENSQSSTAAKLHVSAGTTEFDVMAARHYNDTVVGLGSTGYFRDAAWRLDTTYTHLGHDSGRSGFFSLVGNMDYAWVWQGKNYYGFMEFYYNNLGKEIYSEALADPDIFKRLARGEMFTLGRAYISAEIQIELHPLLNLYLTLIDNLHDPSGIIQPRLIWDVAQNVQLTCGADLYYGGADTEFGGFELPSSNLTYQPADHVFLRLTCFF
jgi:hypothetical protein